MKKIVNRQLGVDPAGAFMGFDDSTSESDLSDIESGKTVRFFNRITREFV